MPARINYRKLAFEAYPPLCAHCGFGIPEVLEVAHLDGNRANNEIENLAILCPNCHKMHDIDLIPTEAIILLRDREKRVAWSKRMKDAGAKAATTRKRKQAARKAVETKKRNAGTAADLQSTNPSAQLPANGNAHQESAKRAHATDHPNLT